MPNTFDVLIVTDPRFPGGTATAVASEVAASADAGYRVGLVAVESATLERAFSFNPRLRALIDAGKLTPVPRGTAVKAPLALLHGPFCAGLRPLEPYRIAAGRRLLVLHHPPFDAAGRPYYRVSEMLAHAAAMLGGPVELAPVGPSVRAQLARLEAAAAPVDWFNVMDARPFARPPRPPNRERPVIGRHSRPDPAKWPATAADCLRAYPDDGRFEVRILGGGPYLAEVLGVAPGDWPDHWEVLPFGAAAVPDFLASLDAYVYYHHPDWVEAFGLAIAEAMAAGVPCVLPKAMAPLFGDAAVCVPIDQAADAALALCADPDAHARRAEAGHRLVAERFGPDAHVRRLQAMIGPPGEAAPFAPVPRRVRLVAADAAGTLMARDLAAHLPPGVEVVEDDAQAVVAFGDAPAPPAGPGAWAIRYDDPGFDPAEAARYVAEAALIHRGERVSAPLYAPRNAG